MNKFVITTDYTADYNDEFFISKNIDRLILPFNIGGEDFDIKEKSLSYPDFYNRMRAGKIATTSQVSQYDAIDVFTKHLEAGFDILHLCFTSGVSGSFENFAPTVKELKEKFPERQIVVIDSLCGSGALAIMVDKAYKMQQDGKSMDEIVSWVEKNKLRFQHFFIVADLSHLKRGGRLSGLEALVGTILGIKPVLGLNHAGKILPMAKLRGQKAYTEMQALTIREIKKDENDYIIVGHGDNIEKARAFGEPIAQQLGIPVVYTFIDYLIGAHAGPDVIAVFFIGNERKNG